MLCALALIGGFVVGRTVRGFEACFSFAQAYMIPLMNPTAIADTLGSVTGSPKKRSPLNAIGNLFNAPAMEYVVDDVTRTHHAEV